MVEGVDAGVDKVPEGLVDSLLVLLDMILAFVVGRCRRRVELENHVISEIFLPAPVTEIQFLFNVQVQQ